MENEPNKTARYIELHHGVAHVHSALCMLGAGSLNRKEGTLGNYFRLFLFVLQKSQYMCLLVLDQWLFAGFWNRSWNFPWMLSEAKPSIQHGARPICVGVTGAQAAGKQKLALLMSCTSNLKSMGVFFSFELKFKVLSKQYVCSDMFLQHHCFSGNSSTFKSTELPEKNKKTTTWSLKSSFSCFQNVPLSLFLSLFYPWQFRLCQWLGMDGCHRRRCQQHDNTAPNAGQGRRKEAQQRTA